MLEKLLGREVNAMLDSALEVYVQAYRMGRRAPRKPRPRRIGGLTLTQVFQNECAKYSC